MIIPCRHFYILILVNQDFFFPLFERSFEETSSDTRLNESLLLSRLPNFAYNDISAIFITNIIPSIVIVSKCDINIGTHNLWPICGFSFLSCMKARFVFLIRICNLLSLEAWIFLCIVGSSNSRSCLTNQLITYLEIITSLTKLFMLPVLSNTKSIQGEDIES